MLHLKDADIAAGNAHGQAWTGRSAAVPVAFARTVGLYTPPAAGAAAKDSAVLLLSPWGLEEMCTRKLWRVLAERFAGEGIASLRFDYPGTGDSLDGAGLHGGLSVWEDAILAAAAELRRLSGAPKLVLVGQGLGATLAATVAPGLGGVDGIALMAPVVSGRFYLREIAAWSKMVDEGLGLDEAQRPANRVSIAGLVMPDAVAADVRKLGTETLARAPAPRALVVARAAREKEAALCAQLQGLGVDTACETYEGYDALVSNPMFSVEPTAVIERVVSWAAATAAPSTGEPHWFVPPCPPRLDGADFIEEPLRFGDGDRLLGIVCRPRGERRGATVILLGTAYDRQSGWARATTETARHLAAKGIASLRFDAANVGDSPPVEGAPLQVQYSDAQIDDVHAALDLLDRRGLAPAVLAGRCSGAFLAFRSAVADTRCKAVVSVNPYTFRWDPYLSVEQILRHNPRSLSDYRRRALSGATLRRLIDGEVDVRRAAGNIAARIARRLARKVPRFLDRFTKQGRLRQAVHADLRGLADRGVPVWLIYSESDVGLEHYYMMFGGAAEDLRSYPDVGVDIVQGADHNMSPPEAQALIHDRIMTMALRSGEKR